jgi:lipopolysaccharide/colanic/teichoic acid biosynthesis glycosyltransferase
MVGRVIAIALRLALIALAYPVMLIVAFLLWHAVCCSLHS